MSGNMALGLTRFFSSLNKDTQASPDKVVGIDFGSSSVKVVEIMNKNNVLTLQTYGELQLGPYADADLGSVTQLVQSKRTEALVDVLRESKVTARNAVMTLPLATSFVTVFSVNAKKGEDLNPRIRVESRKYIPVPMNDVTLDWQELPALGQAPESVREVLVVAVLNTTQAETQGVMQSVNMSAQPTEIELFSTLRALTKDSDESVAMVDLGAQTSKLYIANQGMVRKIHRVFAGGAQATQRISTLLQIPYEEAENRKRNYTQDDASAADIKKTVVTTFERPFQEFKRVLSEYELKTGTPVTRLVITGGTASFADMHSYASYMFDRDVTRANAFDKLAYPAFMEDKLESIAPIFSTAVGAALRQFEVTT